MEDICISYIPQLHHSERLLTFYGINIEAKNRLLQLASFLSSCSNIFLQVPKVGNLVAGELVLVYHRQQWFRGEIVAFPANYDCTVKLIDYGNEETVPLTCVAPVSALDPVLCNTLRFPPLAVKYLLSGLLLPSEHLSDHSHTIIVSVLLNQIFSIRKLGKTGGIDSVIMANEHGNVSDALAKLQVGLLVPALDQPPPVSKAPLPAPIQSTTKTTYEPLVLDMGVIHKVRVSSVDTGPLKFSIQLADELQEIENISARIAQNHRLQPLTEARQTLPCIALSSSDRKYYRAVISKVKSPESVHLYYVDYGHKEVLPIKNLYEIPSEILNPKTYSVRCSLIDFNSEAIFSEKFEAYTKGKIFDCKVGKTYPPEVHLYYESRNVSHILGDWIAPKSICDLAPGNPTSYEKLNIQSNFEANVVVTNMESPSNFYVVQEKDQSGIQAFETFLNSPNYTSSLEQMPVSQMSAMKPCLGAVGPNSQYQRCLILTEPTEPKVYLKSVDTGIVSYVPIDKVMPIRTETVTIMPAQALNCTLDGFEGRSVPKSILDEFKFLVSDKLLKMTVLKICGEKLVVNLLDLESGQEISQILAVHALTPQPGIRAAVSKPIRNPPRLTLNKVESVWCMLVFPENKFFGQLERFSNENLDNMQCELLDVYKALTNPPLLYADVKSHIGDCAVVRFPEDNAYYRAKVLKEIAQDVEVMFIDYGNFLTVDRSEVFSPVSMKYWNQKPFGHLFQFDADVPIITCDELSPLLVDKSVELQIVKQDENIAICVFSEDPKNQPIASMLSQHHYKQNPKGSVFSRLGPITDQKTGKEYRPKRLATPEDTQSELPATKPLWGEQGQDERPQRNFDSKFQKKGPITDQKTGKEYRPKRLATPEDTQSQLPSTKPLWGEQGQDERPQRNFDSKFQKKDPNFDHYSKQQQTSESGWDAEPSTKLTWKEPKRDERPQRGYESKNWRNTGDGDSFIRQPRERGDFAGGKPREFNDRKPSKGKSRCDEGSYRHTSNSKNQWQLQKTKFQGEKDWTTSDTGDQVSTPAFPVAKKALKFKPVNLSVGATEKCQVVYVNSPKEFYVQLEKNIPEIDEMSEKINSYFSGNIFPKTEFKENTVCCAKFTVDQMWYRGVIEKVSANSATIYFVDYGNRQETEFSDLRDLEEDQVVLPAQACKCALSFVDAGEEMKSRFEEETSAKSLSLTVVRKIPSARTFLVNLRDDGESLNVKYGGLGVETPFHGNLSPPMFTIGSSQDSYLCYYKSPVCFGIGNVSKRNDFNRLFDELNDFYNGLTESEMKQDIIEVGAVFVVRSADDGKWNRSICEQIEGQKLTVLLLDYGAHEIHYDKKNFHSLHPRFADLPARALRCKLKGVVVPESYTSSIIESKLLAKSVVQIIPFEPVDDLHPVSIVSDGTDVASALIEAGVVLKEPEHLPINIIADALASPLEELGSEPKAGDFVSAIFDEDGLYYRANIKSIENGQANVYLIDYGNESAVKVEELRKIPSSIAGIPPQLETPIDKIAKVLSGDLEPLSSDPQIGDEVAAIYSVDDLYYRAEISCIVENTVNVYFIDYGNDDTTDIELLREIPESIRNIPPQREQNNLHESTAVAVSSAIPATDSAETPIDKITKELAGDLKPLSGDPQIGDEVAAIYSVDDLYYRAEISCIVENTVNVYFIDYGNDDTTDIELLREIPESIRNIPPQREQINLHESTAVVVSSSIPATGSAETPIDKITKELAGDLEPLLGDPQVGDAVAAIFSVDNLYYRAEISSIKENIINVYFVDYDNEDTTEVKNLRKIPESICKIPPQLEAEAESVINETSGKGLKTLEPEKVEAISKEPVEVIISEALKKGLEPLKKEPQIGDFVAAAFDDAGPFYRAQVMELLEGNADLLSIDYGKTCTVAITKLKKIPSSIYSYPPQLRPEIIDNDSDTALVLEEQEPKGEDSIEVLEQKIQDALIGELSPLQTAPQEGCLVAAVFNLDKLYYRAQIKSIHDDQARVIFIDYGNEDVTDIANMKEIPELVKNIRPLFVEEISACVVAEEDIDSLVYENSKDESLVTENAWEAIRAAFELPLNSINNAEVGDLIACKLDGQFERARILSCHDKITCNLIDIGKTVLVDYTQLYEVPLAIRDIPPLSKIEIKDSMLGTTQEFEEAPRGMPSPNKTVIRDSFDEVSAEPEVAHRAAFSPGKLETQSSPSKSDIETSEAPQNTSSACMVDVMVRDSFDEVSAEPEVAHRAAFSPGKLETQSSPSKSDIETSEAPQNTSSACMVDVKNSPTKSPIKPDDTPQDVPSLNNAEVQDLPKVSPTKVEETVPDVTPLSSLEAQDYQITDPIKVEETLQEVPSLSSISHEKLKEIPASVYNFTSCFDESQIMNGETNLDICVKTITSDVESTKPDNVTDNGIDCNTSENTGHDKDVLKDMECFEGEGRLVPCEDEEKSVSDLL
ncbi:hypothetical protein QYM36_001568 [Artemia franciscana]|uniref:Tudor domain-containing protein n=1 Tax=Artemia franciscana TaxID=6661 RepID=A0AA88LCB1_ARTSF|nr:hypothetical protein QYM36_001568 [Artemia franciscana]